MLAEAQAVEVRSEWCMCTSNVSGTSESSAMVNERVVGSGGGEGGGGRKSR